MKRGTSTQSLERTLKLQTYTYLKSPRGNTKRHKTSTTCPTQPGRPDTNTRPKTREGGQSPSPPQGNAPVSSSTVHILQIKEILFKQHSKRGQNVPKGEKHIQLSSFIKSNFNVGKDFFVHCFSPYSYRHCSFLFIVSQNIR